MKQAFDPFPCSEPAIVRTVSAFNLSFMNQEKERTQSERERERERKREKERDTDRDTDRDLQQKNDWKYPLLTFVRAIHMNMISAKIIPFPWIRI